MVRQIDKWMDGWMDGWINGWMDEQRQTDKCMVDVLKNLFLFRSKCNYNLSQVYIECYQLVHDHFNYPSPFRLVLY